MLVSSEILVKFWGHITYLQAIKYCVPRIPRIRFYLFGTDAAVVTHDPAGVLPHTLSMATTVLISIAP